VKRYAISTEDVGADVLPLVAAVRAVAQDFFALADMVGDDGDPRAARPVPRRVVTLLGVDVRKNVRDAEERAAAFAKRFEPIRSRSTQVPPGRGPGEGAAGCAADASASPREDGPENDGASGPRPGPDAVE